VNQKIIQQPTKRGNKSGGYLHSQCQDDRERKPPELPEEICEKVLSPQKKTKREMFAEGPTEFRKRFPLFLEDWGRTC